jgi:hypothetical protein
MGNSPSISLLGFPITAIPCDDGDGGDSWVPAVIILKGFGCFWPATAINRNNSDADQRLSRVDQYAAVFSGDQAALRFLTVLSTICIN